MRYKADEWEHSRRVVLVVVAPREDELFARFFFLVTTFSADTMHGELLVDLYRERGVYEQMIGQFKSTLTPQLSSTTRTKSHYRGKGPEAALRLPRCLPAPRQAGFRRQSGHPIAQRAGFQPAGPGGRPPRTRSPPTRATQEVRSHLHKDHSGYRAPMLPEATRPRHAPFTQSVALDLRKICGSLAMPVAIPRTSGLRSRRSVTARGSVSATVPKALPVNTAHPHHLYPSGRPGEVCRQVRVPNAHTTYRRQRRTRCRVIDTISPRCGPPRRVLDRP